MKRTGLLAMAAVVLAVGLAACGAQAADDVAASPTAGGGSPPAAGICPQDQPDCVDTPQLNSDEPVPVDETGVAQFRRDAKYYLGRPQDELPDRIRIARIGDEQFALTQDYQVGRITVELDDVDGDGTPIVTSATVELPNGPETFKLEK